MNTNDILCGDAADILSTLPEQSVDLVVTDPPYLVNYRDRSEQALRNDDSFAVQIIDAYVARDLRGKLVAIGEQYRRSQPT